MDLQTSERLSHAATLATLILVVVFLAAILYALGRGVYNVVLHPLRTYPGPFLWRTTSAFSDYHTFRGTLHTKVVQFHAQYGPVVRLAPNTLTFTSSQARKEILAHFPGKEENPKDMGGFAMPPNGHQSILLSDKETHARFRRLLSHAFSERGLKAQEGHINDHIDLLVERLSEKARAGQQVDMVDYYNMTTFDIIGDLAFGESFDCLKDGGVMHD